MTPWLPSEAFLCPWAQANPRHAFSSHACQPAQGLGTPSATVRAEPQASIGAGPHEAEVAPRHSWVVDDSAYRGPLSHGCGLHGPRQTVGWHPYRQQAAVAFQGNKGSAVWHLGSQVQLLGFMYPPQTGWKAVQWNLPSSASLAKSKKARLQKIFGAQASGRAPG